MNNQDKFNYDISFIDDRDYGAQRRLEQLGYKQELDRNLSVFDNVNLTRCYCSTVQSPHINRK